MPAEPNERNVVLLVAAVQFVNILDFMIVVPLGPFLADGLDIATDQVGLVAAAYTASAACAGVAGSLFLDSFDRRRALALAMLGLVIGTAAGALATGLYTLLLARAIAGAFGGPATSLAFSIVADVVPAERRGKALGTLGGAFAVASVLGVPFGLELANRGDWWWPFAGVSAIGAVVAAGAVWGLPPLVKHLHHGTAVPRLRDIARRPTVLVAWAATVVLFMAGFVIIPHIPTYLVHNLDFPEDGLGFLYLVGGAVSFFTMRLVGSLVDRVGSVPIAAIGAAVMVPLVYEGFARVPPLVPVLLLFVLFMAGMNFRMISYNALASRVPRPAERARFASINSSIQHLSAAAGGVLSWQILVEAPDRSLVGMPTVAYVAMALFAAGPAAVLAVERMLGREGAND